MSARRTSEKKKNVGKNLREKRGDKTFALRKEEKNNRVPRPGGAHDNIYFELYEILIPNV